MCKRQMCLVALVLLLGCGTAAQADVTDGLKGLWEFNNAGNLIEASLGNDLILNGAGQSVVPGVSGTDGAVAVEAGTSYQSDHGIPANGGGAYVNEFTLLFDVMYPQGSAGQWRAFYQTGYETYNDSEYFIHPADESWGVGDLGYTDNATVGEWYSSHSTWYRVVLTVNLDSDPGAAFHDLYIDGVLKGKHNTGSLGIDGRFSLYTADDSDPYIVFCGDDNGDDALMHFSNIAIWDRPLTPQEIAGLGGPGDPIVPWNPELASKPNPDNGQQDVGHDVVLSWESGEFAAQTNGHIVYLSENFNDVNDGIGGVTQSDNSYAWPQRLDFNTTYYWRVDEVNAPPTSTVFQGNVWQFTTEPIAYPIDGSNITAAASSTHQADAGPEDTINGSGLDANDLHSMEATDMWLSGDEPNGACIEYELDKVHKLHEMWVWNANQMVEPMIGFGLKDVTIEYSVDGNDYATLGTTHEFVRAPGTADYAHNTTVDLSGAAAKYIRLTTNSNWGGLTDQYGLSEVRFLSIPVFAREPSPDSGTSDVAVDVTLGFRAGREAVTHDVYLSSDEQAVIDGNTPVTTVTETNYGPLSLDLGTTYYWRVDEVNEADTTTTWQGEIWNFSTPEFFGVENFEDYNDYPPDEIWFTWVDGYGVPANGATSGYPAPDFLAGEHYVETTIVHGGSQSMPFFYDNTGTATYSEAERTFAAPQDWTKASVQTLSLYFRGAAGNTGQLYVKVNGSKVVYDGDAGNLALAGWQAWNIELAEFGTNLQTVATLAIGIDGSGASGTLYLDDFRLYAYSREFITPVEPNNAGLVGHWKFDGDTLDYSGLGNDGTAGGDPTFVAGTVGSGALDFDGDDYVVLGEGGALNFGDATDFSVVLWIKWAGTSSDPAFISNKDWNGGSNTGYVIADGGSTWQWNWNVSGGSRVDYDPDGPTLDDNQWHHLCVTHDRDGFAIFYVDGVYQDRLDISGSTGSIDSGMPHVIAQDGTTTYGATYAGLIDDARIYNYALSLAEVAWLTGKTLPFDKPF